MIRESDQRVTASHRNRDAVVYVRQSDEKQVRENVESTRIQVGLREHAITLGWPQPVLVDDDLGVSATGFADRPGFQKLTTCVTMRQVGIILCVDASRLSRNSRDWAHLFQLCGFFDTLVADLDQVYDLSLPNDRLVLGIKGILSENELHVLRNRMRTGLEAKAARGELRTLLPPGYGHDDERIVFDPDRRVQTAIRQLFDQFDRCNSVRQLAMWYRDTATLFPIRTSSRNPGIEWQVPTAKTLQKLLVHPIYAGVYAWGRRSTRVEYEQGRLVKRTTEASLSPEKWRVCIQDNHPAYVTWERILANVARVAENRARWKMDDNQGAIREGLALLTGLLRCRTCGSRLYVNYKNLSALYSCDGGHTKGSRRCMSFGACEIDHRVSEELLGALESRALRASIAAFEQGEKEWSQRLDSLRLQVEAAQYEADRAFEQYDRVDPKNRLVADTLEVRLNEKLAQLHAAKERREHAAAEAPRLTEEERKRIHELAADLPQAWNHPQADPKLKKRILRAALREIVVEHQPEQKRLEVTLHWQGGVHTQIHVKKYDRRRGSAADPDLVEMARRLAEDGIRDAEMARVLNMQGTRTPRDLPWTVSRARSFRQQHQITLGDRPSPSEYMTQTEAARYLGVSRNGLLGMERIGAITRNQVVAFAPWRVERKQLESEQVQALARALKTTGRLPRGGCPEGQLSLLGENQGSPTTPKKGAL